MNNNIETHNILSSLLAVFLQNIETGYYERGDDYYDIRDYKNTSVHQVYILYIYIKAGLQQSFHIGMSWPELGFGFVYF